MNIKKHFSLVFFIILILLFLFIFFSAKSYSQTMFNNISDNFFRLHIVANSDSTEDQMIKYQIRDSILNYMEPFLKNAKSKEEAISILKLHESDLYNLATDILVSNNLSYPVKINIGKYYFPTKQYSSITLPEGNYDALKIELGSASGQNWWCVMFPSLCLINSSDFCFSGNSENFIKNNLSSEELEIISSDTKSKNIKIKFKLIELFENM